MCHPVRVLADGNLPLKERLLDIDHDRRINHDYKVTLADAQVAINLRRIAQNQAIDTIRLIPDTRLRAIAAMLHAQLSPSECADLLGITTRHLRRLCRG